MIPLNARRQQVLWTIRKHREISQSQIHETLGIRKNTISDDIAGLISLGLVRPSGRQPLTRGRPRSGLEINSEARQVIGLSIQAGRVEICSLSLLGEVVSAPVRTRVRNSRELIPAAAKLLRDTRSAKSFSIGLATPGLIDLDKHQVMLSVLEPGRRSRNIQQVLAAAGHIPLVIENDVHAMSARWLLSQLDDKNETVLFVFVADGQVGAAVLVDGHPTPGCLVGSHELGHSRLPIKTRRCYCGQQGCLERIFSSDYLHDTTNERLRLDELLRRFPANRSAVQPLISLLGCGIANVVNFLRPHRLVLVGDLLSNSVVRESVKAAIHGQILRALADRVHIEFWHQPALRSAEMAGWLALAAIYKPGWLGAIPTRTVNHGRSDQDSGRKSSVRLATVVRRGPS
jgi:predicted NBD/HSP70 family sugar kinase